MSINANRWLPLPQISMLAGAAMAAIAPAALTSYQALAEDNRSETAFRLYFAVPFIAALERQPARLGFQLMSEFENDPTYTYAPLISEPELRPAVDLGFTRDGLAKFDVHGADMRGAYESFARAIGLTAEETELCRNSDCLDWVKDAEDAVVSTAGAALE